MNNFADRLTNAIERSGTCAVVGIDPRLDSIPAALRDAAFDTHGKTLAGAAAALLEFGKGVVDAVAGIVPVVKPQIAFFEMYGPPGVAAYAQTLDYASSKGLIVIGDIKRSDIGSTAAAYAAAHLGAHADLNGAVAFNSDAVTVNPYLGTDGLKPFVDAAAAHGKGVFVLARTSNPSAGELQDARINGEPVFLAAARLAKELGDDLVGESGFSSVGIVAGATFPSEAKALRELSPEGIFLVPGYGAQGATASDLAPFFTTDRKGVLVNASRSVIFAYSRPPYSEKFGEAGWQDAVNAAAIDMLADLATIFG